MATTFLKVRVQPGARRGEIVGWQGDVLRVRVQAPPIEGRANEAVIELLSDALGVSKRQIGVRTGLSGREKLLAIDGLTPEELASRLPPR